jgi:two-component system sensor histidine kinase KdpD
VIQNTVNTGNLSKTKQYLLVIAVISIVIITGLFLRDSVGHRVVAFVLLLSISVLALFLDIKPMILAAVLSALLWDYLFIPPLYTFNISTTEDRLLFTTYFIVALLHGVLTFKIREAQKEIRKREEKASSVKFYNTLLNSLSHELRTPITTIIGACDNILSNNTKLSENNKHELLEEISTAAIRLNHQVENLLNMSRLESGVFKMKKDWCDVRELIYNALNRFDIALKDFPVTVFVPENFPLFKLDYGLMEQILANLINNIIQHTPVGTSFVITADCVEEKLVLSIADTGKGFPESEVEKVFEKFYRLKGSRPGGTGLGLSIVRGFVEAQGGTIALRNLPLSGAEFTMTFATEISYLSGLKNE